MSAPRWPLPWDVELRGSGFAVVAADGSALIDPDGPLTSHRAVEVCAIGDRALAAEAERDAMARRIDRVRTMCADAQVTGGHLRPDAVLAVLDMEDTDA